MLTLGWNGTRHESGKRMLGVALAATTIALALCAGPVSAAEGERAYNRFEITPFGGYLSGGEFEEPADGSDLDVDDSFGYGLFFNIADEYWRHYEFFYADFDTEVKGAAPFDFKVQYLQIGGTVSHPDARYAIPYFGLSVGAARFSPDAPGLNNETEFAFSVGGGLRIPITDHVGVRFDARAFVTVLDSAGELFCVSDIEGGACRIRAKSDTFLQYTASLGVMVGF